MPRPGSHVWTFLWDQNQIRFPFGLHMMDLWEPSCRTSSWWRGTSSWWRGGSGSDGSEWILWFFYQSGVTLWPPARPDAVRFLSCGSGQQLFINSFYLFCHRNIWMFFRSWDHRLYLTSDFIFNWSLDLQVTSLDWDGFTGPAGGIGSLFISFPPVWVLIRRREVSLSYRLKTEWISLKSFGSRIRTRTRTRNNFLLFIIYLHFLHFWWL